MKYLCKACRRGGHEADNADLGIIEVHKDGVLDMLRQRAVLDMLMGVGFYRCEFWSGTIDVFGYYGCDEKCSPEDEAVLDEAYDGDWIGLEADLAVPEEYRSRVELCTLKIGESDVLWQCALKHTDLYCEFGPIPFTTLIDDVDGVQEALDALGWRSTGAFGFEEHGEKIEQQSQPRCLPDLLSLLGEVADQNLRSASTEHVRRRWEEILASVRWYCPHIEIGGAA